MTRDDQWRRACKEIIDRCVAPDMYGNAMAMLERAYEAATATGNTMTANPDIGQPTQAEIAFRQNKGL